MNNPRASATFYDHLAPDYDAAVSRHATSPIRHAFLQLVRSYVPSGSLLFDFGCGTGTDALWYIAQGYRVLAYDNSSGMVEVLKTKGADAIQQGQLTAFSTPYVKLPSILNTYPTSDAIVSNFAVINEIPAVAEWFALMATILKPGGYLIVSILNPFYWWDMGGAWWWKGLWRGRKQGYILNNTASFQTYRHTIASLRKAASPHFTLIAQRGVGILLPLEHRFARFPRPFIIARHIEQRFGGHFPVYTWGNFRFLVFKH